MIKNKKGFTLIELIITMAIVGILAVAALVAIGDKSIDARDARRLYDMSIVQFAMSLTCAEGGTLTLPYTGSSYPRICKTLGNSYINFSNVNDPLFECNAGSSLGCTRGGAWGVGGICNYGYGLPGTGNGYSTVPLEMDPCNYWINFYQEGDDGSGFLRDEGLVK